MAQVWHVEGYICAIQEEGINTKLLKHKRLREGTNLNCRLCHTQRESIQHIIACCPKLSASMYLPIRHISRETKFPMKLIQEVYSNEDKEIWWDTKIKTSPTREHNKPDIVLWLKEKKCYIIDIKVRLDININKNIDQKHDTYFLLSVELKRLYKDYMFDVIQKCQMKSVMKL